MAAHARGNPVHASGSAGDAGEAVAHQRLQGAFLTVIGLAGMFGGVMFSIEAPRFTPVPVVFLTFWLIMVIVGRIFFTGLSKLRSAGVGAPAPEQVRAAAAVAGIVVAVGMMGFAATGPGAGVASAAPCPGGGPATCGPGPGPELTITPPAQQTTAPGGQQGNQGSGQDNNGIATSPAGSGGNDGGNIQAQTPDFGAPGQQAPNIPGNPTEQAPQPGQGQGQGQQQQGRRQSPVQTTAAGGPQQSQQTGQQTQTGQASPSKPTVTFTQTQSECPAPGAAGANGGPGAPGAGTDRGGSGNGGDGGPDGGDSDGKEGAPSWAYLAGEASALLTGRRRPSTGGVTPAGLGGGQGPAAPAQDTAAAVMQQPGVGGAGEPRMEVKPATQTYDRLVDPAALSEGDGGGGASSEPVTDSVSEQVLEFEPAAGSSDDSDDEEQQPEQASGDEAGGDSGLVNDIRDELGEDQQARYLAYSSPEETQQIIDDLEASSAALNVPKMGPHTPEQQAILDRAAQVKPPSANPVTGPMRDAIAQAEGRDNPTQHPFDTVLQETGHTKPPPAASSPLDPLDPVVQQVQNPDAPTDGFGAVLAERDRQQAPARLQRAREAEQERQRRITEAPAAWDKFFGGDAASLRDYFLDDVYPVDENTVRDGRNYIRFVTMSDGSQLVIHGRDGVNPFTDTTLSRIQVTGSSILGDAELDVPNGKASPTPGTLEALLKGVDSASWAAVVVPGGGVVGRIGSKAATKAAQKAFLGTAERLIAEGAPAIVVKREAQAAAKKAAQEALEQAEKRAAAAGFAGVSAATKPAASAAKTPKPPASTSKPPVAATTPKAPTVRPVGTSATLGASTSSSYRNTFFKAYPNVPKNTVVHHAIEQRVLKAYPGLISKSQLHSLQNLRGIPQGVNSSVHLSQIRRMWDAFYMSHPPATTTLEDLLKFATRLDDRFGHLFNPPLR
ncbi:hypothetical protein [Tsukamurella pulmonis]|uniref:hypothetical protein n=1 Tax=Tsukamurella pulmonis TaxID=47312 RepID=UPI001401CEA3|nr:hypothetical protein [Tsukamurella pulmonis]